MKRVLTLAAFVTACCAVLLTAAHDSGHSTLAWHQFSVRAAMAQTLAFMQSFDGTPAAPGEWRPTDWDVVLNVGDAWAAGEVHTRTMMADHGADCGPPPATHEIHEPMDAVFQCNGHIMTAINEGYGVIYLTPNQMVDFATGEAVIRWDMSTLRRSSRDWMDLWITPFESNLVVPADDWLPAYQGEPRDAIHVRMDGSETGTILKASVIRDHVATGLPRVASGYETFLAPSAVRRDQFEVRVSRSRIRVGMPAYNVWWVDSEIKALGWNRGVVQFGHHTYEPTKGCNDSCTNTWHWDNVSFSSARPFTILRADERSVSPTTISTATFPFATPENAFLRFAAVGDKLELSFDDGRTWQPAVRQDQEGEKAEHFSSYWTPVPAGVSRIQFRGQRFWGGPWMIQDISVWSAS